MRYIRTKDGRICYLSDEPNEETSDYEIITSKGTLTYRRKDEVIKVADTIEELCDVIVCRNELFYPLTSNREGNEFDWEEIDRFRKTIVMSEDGYNRIKETSNDFEPYFWKVYGAIWTDKGLIYVAKMNEKGVLELL